MAAGTNELAPPDENGDDRRADVAEIKQMERQLRDSPTTLLRDGQVVNPLSPTSGEKTPRTPTQEMYLRQATLGPQIGSTVLGGRTLFDGGRRVRTQGPAAFRQMLPHGIRSRSAGIEGPAFDKSVYSRQGGAAAVRVYKSHVQVTPEGE